MLSLSNPRTGYDDPGMVWNFLIQILHMYTQFYFQVFYFLVVIVIAVINRIFSTILSSGQLMFDCCKLLLYSGTLLNSLLFVLVSSLILLGLFRNHLQRNSPHSLPSNSYASNYLSCLLSLTNPSNIKLNRDEDVVILVLLGASWNDSHISTLIKTLTLFLQFKYFS